MIIEKIDVSAAVDKTRNLLKKDKSISPGLVAAVKLLITVITILLNQKNLNSRNSSKPPSQDPNRPRKTRKDKGQKRGKRQPGGQLGHTGATLDPVDDPNTVEEILIDKRTLPHGHYTHVGFEPRQVFDVEISLHVTEYLSEILQDQNGVEWIAKFPDGVNNPAQYGKGLKAHSVYMSQFQLIPHLRVADYFNDQLGVPLSKASVQNFNILAYKALESFENWAKQALLSSDFNNADETGVKVNGKQFWFHLLSNDKVALYQVDEKRGKEAMDRMGILPQYKGIVCHDHWKPYYRYNFTHALCNAHHLRELQRAWEQDGQKWAKQMKCLLERVNKKVNESEENKLSDKGIKYYEKRYCEILDNGERECPKNTSYGKKGRTKQTKSRNLLDRLRNFENDTLRFMKEPMVSFSNNKAENDLRMTKVQQKISGCFRSLEGAKVFCRIRSFLLTCQKNGVKPTEGLRELFQGNLPKFNTS